MDYLPWVAGCIFCGSIAYVYGKRYLQNYVMRRLKDELDRRLEAEEQDEAFKPMHQNSAVLKIKHGGKSHSVFVPYNRKKSTTMLRKKVFLVKGEEKIEISQKPGVPYLICANDLGGDSILIEDLEGNFIKSFSADEIPKF